MNFDLHAAARALDGKVIGQQIRCPGPNHSASDDSLSVKLEGDDIVVHSFAGDDVNTCKDYVRSRLGLPKWEKPANDDPFANMQARAAKRPQPEPEHDPWTCITPIPDDAFPLDVRLGGKEPRFTWLFKDTEDRVLGVECRWLKPDGKDIRFATWCRHDNGRTEWRLKHLPAPRPIFGLDRLKSAPLAPVLIVEGAKKVAPATKLFPDYVAMAWPAGAEGAKHVDWSPLKSREVVIWPDNDEAGRKAAVKIADLVIKAGADSASVVPVPTDFPPKWDLADKAPDGSDLAALLEAARPAKQVRIPIQSGHPIRFEAGRHCDMKSATVPI